MIEMKIALLQQLSLSNICGILGIILILVNDIVSGYQFDYDSLYPNELKSDDMIPTDKRYAMLSYSFRPQNRYGSRRRYRPYRRHYRYIYKYSNNYSQYRDKPWMKLPNKWCYRQSCSTSKDCCRKHNICDTNVRRCIDCWYGYPCQKNADCCDRFPVCSMNSCKN